MRDIQLKEGARKFIRYDKHVANELACLAFDRPQGQQATTTGMRQVFTDLIFRARAAREASSFWLSTGNRQLSSR